jgi:hypothetical protein
MCGTSVSNDVPLMTNAGVTQKSSVAQTGWGEKRRASDHTEAVAMNEKRI